MHANTKLTDPRTALGDFPQYAHQQAPIIAYLATRLPQREPYREPACASDAGRTSI